MTDKVECVVIGAGVVGLAVAAQLAAAGREVIVLEQHSAIGTETSSRNSEVIHAGIYYPSGSRKAELCVRGKALLYQHCDTYAVPYKRCGKVIVATSDAQRPVVDGYIAQASANGVTDLRWIDQVELNELEPEVMGVGAALSPSTGIIDSHAYMISLQGIIEANGGFIAFQNSVQGIDHVTISGTYQSNDPRSGLGDQCRWPARTGTGPKRSGLAKGALRHRTLLHLFWRTTLRASCVPHGRAGRFGGSCHPRSRRASEVRPGRALDRLWTTPLMTVSARTLLMPYALTIPGWMKNDCSPATRAFGPRLMARVVQPIF